MRFEALSSTTTMAMLATGVRSSRRSDGPASAASSTSAASPRSHQPVSPRQSASATPTSASAASAAISGSGSSGAKVTACIYWPSRSSSAGTCTWSDL